MLNPKILPEIFYEDNHLIVLGKPAGLLSQGEKTGDENLVDWLRQKVGRKYVGLVHRLDRNTSGIMVVAKRTKAASRLSAFLVEGHIRRSYLAFVEGKLNQEVLWQHRLWKDPKLNKVEVVSRNHPQGKDASLRARPTRETVWRGRNLTLVEYVLETGRSHQIRVQSAKEGFPILGDHKYGKPPFDFPRPALHSFEITFPHPMDVEKIMNFKAPLPADMGSL